MSETRPTVPERASRSHAAPDDPLLRAATKAAWSLHVYTDALKENRRPSWPQKVKAMGLAIKAAEEFDGPVSR